MGMPLNLAPRWALLLAAAAPPLASAGFPRLSWGTVGDLAFLHASTLNELAWSDADAAVAAKFPMVTIEKWQGCNATPGCYKSAAPPAACPTQQDGTLATARKLKALAPTVWIAAWLDSLRIYEPLRALNPDYLDTSWQACVRPAASPFLDAHPGYLLPNSSGLPAEEPYIHAHVFDHRKPEVRALWRDVCLNLTSTGLVDGCGADASQQPFSYIGGVGAAVGAAWEAGRNWTLGNTTAALAPAGGFLLGKLGFELGAYTNGVLQEGCVAGNATITTLRAAAARAAADATRYVFECHSNGSPDDLAAFLIGAGADPYFGFGAWVDDLPAASHWVAEMGFPLGAPVADAAYDAPTATWSRAFASAAGRTNVTFDARTNRGAIAWASTRALL